MSQNHAFALDHTAEGVTRRTFLRGAACLPAALGAAMTAASARAEVLETRALLSRGWEYHQGSLGGIWEVWRGDDATDSISWTPVGLPHCFNASDAVDPDAPVYQGPGWYRIRQRIRNPYPHGRTLLHFEGAGQKTELFIHLEKVAKHVGGYDEFAIDITDEASRLENEGTLPIAVCCDNGRDLEMIPSNLSDFNVYGGLYRGVSLVYTPAISVERIHVDAAARPEGSGSVSIGARLFNPAALKGELQAGLRIADPRGRTVHESLLKTDVWVGERELATFRIENPELWSPATPALYRLTLSLESRHGRMEATERFGFRYFEWTPRGPFKLNGERLLLRGTHRHEDHAGCGAAVPEEVTRKEMRMIKAMGANFVRLAHYQQSHQVLDLCDELGLLVWEEIPWCRGGLGGERYKAQARDMLTAMIDQHRSHCSVILWGLGNENDWPGDFPVFDKNAIREFMAELNGLAHRLDPTRKTSIRRCDFCRDIPDVYSPSIWAGWYSGRYTEYKDAAAAEMEKVRHFFHAEWGGDSHQGRHSEDPESYLARMMSGSIDERGKDYLLTGGQTRASQGGDWSETYICNLFDWYLKEQETMPWLTGSAQWVFKDFSTPLRPENPIPRVNQKGVVGRDLQPKESYYLFQSYWGEAAMAHIYGHTWPVRWGQAGEGKLVKVYSNCVTVELFVNGKSAGVRKRESQNFPAAGLHWIVTFPEGENHLRAVARRGAAEVVDEVRFRYETRRWGLASELVLREIERSGKVLKIEALLLDANGCQCLDARNRVRFDVAGDGRLLDNLGAVGGSRVVELVNGKAVISLECNGQVVAGVRTPGVPTAFLHLEI